MQGQRPKTESLALIANALGLDILHLLELAGHIPPGVLKGQGSERLSPLIATLRQAESAGRLTDDRYSALRVLVDWVHNTPVAAGN